MLKCWPHLKNVFGLSRHVGSIHKFFAKNSHIFVRHGAPFCGQEMEIEELKEKLSSGIPREMAVLEERLEATGTGRRMS